MTEQPEQTEETERTGAPPPKRPGVAFAGFLLPCLLLLAVVLAYQAEYLSGLGWRGGEYAYAFLGVALGAALAGGLLKLVQRGSPWRSFGSGLLLGGTLGVVLTIVIIVLFVIALSRAVS